MAQFAFADAARENDSVTANLSAIHAWIEVAAKSLPEKWAWLDIAFCKQALVERIWREPGERVGTPNSCGRKRLARALSGAAAVCQQ